MKNQRRVSTSYSCIVILARKPLQFDNLERSWETRAHRKLKSGKARVLIKCRQPAKKPATWRLEQSTFWGNRVKLESESLKLPTALSYQTAYFNILAVYLKH